MQDKNIAKSVRQPQNQTVSWKIFSFPWNFSIYNPPIFKPLITAYDITLKA